MVLLIHCHNVVLFAVVSLLCTRTPRSFSAELQPVLMQLFFAFSLFPLLCPTCIFLCFTYDFSAEVLSNCISQ